jgi:hypothetical protein
MNPRWTCKLSSGARDGVSIYASPASLARSPCWCEETAAATLVHSELSC